MAKKLRPQRMTVIELEKYLRETIPPGISREMIYNHIRRAGVQVDANHRLDVAQFLDAYVRHKQDDNKIVKPAGFEAGQDPKRYKIVLECAILKIKHDQLKGTIVPLADMQTNLRELAQWVKDIHSQWIADVKVLTGDQKVVEDAERLRDNLFAKLREKCKEVQ